MDDNDIEMFLSSVADEAIIAEAKFEYPNPNLAALMEEVGELAKAMLQKESPREIYREAVKVATMAMRCALEGDPQFPDYKP